jgi:hypothetical protein
MSRSMAFLAFSGVLLAAPAEVVAQKGGKGPGFSQSGGQQCQKGQQSSTSAMPNYGMPPQQAYALQLAYAQQRAYAAQPSYPQQGYALPAGTPVQQGLSVLSTLVSQLRAKGINSATTKALGADLSEAKQIYLSTSLSKEQKEAKLLTVLTRTLADIQDLKTDPALSPAQQQAITGVAVQFEEIMDRATLARS